MANVETGELGSRISLYQQTHLRKSGQWCQGSQEIYEKMIALQNESLQDGTSRSDSDICDEVLGRTSGYVRGLGHGFRPGPSSSAHARCQAQLLEVQQRAKEDRKRAENNRKQASETIDRLNSELQEMRQWRAQVDRLIQTGLAGFSSLVGSETQLSNDASQARDN